MAKATVTAAATTATASKVKLAFTTSDEPPKRRIKYGRYDWAPILEQLVAGKIVGITVPVGVRPISFRRVAIQRTLDRGLKVFTQLSNNDRHLTVWLR